MFRYLKLTFFCLMLHTLIFPDFVAGQLAQPQKPLRLSVDVAKFRGDVTHTKLEIYQSINRQGLKYKNNNPGYIARFKLDTKIIQKDSVVFQEEIVETDTVFNNDHIEPGQQFIFTQPFFLKPGHYQILTILQDINNGTKSSNRVPVEISIFPEDSLVLSDIQFASHIKKATDLNNPFVKNNLHVMPNPQSLYGDGMENLTFYAELYNLGFSNGSEGTYCVDYIIENTEGKTLSRIRGKQRPQRGRNAAIYTSFDLSTLESNRYILKLDVIDNTTNRHADVSKTFSIFRKADALALEIDQERKVYREFDEPALQNYFEQIAYIATNEEKKVFKQLELKGKREFLFQFWQTRDPSPGTPENEFKNDYIQRLFKTKINFSVTETDGWKTDRGRIFLIYGPPDFLDREPALPDRNAHEIWSYETLQGVQGQSIFVFIDLADNGKYRLIHSDYRDEITNPDWESYLYK